MPQLVRVTGTGSGEFATANERLIESPSNTNGKTDTNNNHAFSTDNIGMNYDYPEASYDERAKIVADHVRYQQGLMWTLANQKGTGAGSARDSEGGAA